MSKLLLALALHGACAFVRPAAPDGPMTAARATTKDALAAGYQPTEGVNAAVDTNNKGDAWVNQMSRPRRNRKSAGVRSMVRETFLTPANLMQPIFIHEDSDEVVPIASMPGQSRHTLASMVEQVKKGMALGVKSFILFPKVPAAGAYVERGQRRRRRGGDVASPRTPRRGAGNFGSRDPRPRRG
mmetsp:Transcript_20522/g.61363  ORF Transcript_20522/g.61363 Transcript_20522/m.61363 type:complete len:185 (+) Transcript_20522:133-687(+)